MPRISRPRNVAEVVRPAPSTWEFPLFSKKYQPRDASPGSGAPLRASSTGAGALRLMPLRVLEWWTAVFVILLAGSAPASAIDTVIRRSTERPAAGTIDSVSRTEIVVKPSIGEPVVVPANDVVEVQWEAAPPSLSRGRTQEASGQFDLALASYQEAATESAGANANLRADIQFRIARVQAQLAFGDPEQLPAAMQQLKAFVENQRDHYFFYDAQLLLGEVGLAADDAATADSAYQTVLRSPWNDYQMAAQIGAARILFARGDVAGAKSGFDAVVAANAASTAEVSRRLEAMLGQAMCLQHGGDHADAVEILDRVVKESAAGDTRLQAEAYLRQGESLVAVGEDPKQAIMAYLHIDVVPSLAQESDLHAQALYHLSQLWSSVGQPGRAAEAAGRLQQQYPNSEWSAKLSGG